MSSVLLILFVILLVLGMLYSLRYPGVAITLAIATYGLKQIATATLPFLQIYDTVFNYILGGLVSILFVFGVITKSIYVCNTTIGKKIVILIWMFLGLFWASSFWSPFKGGDSLRLMPYFVVYVFMLPYLMGNPKQMIKAFWILWLILLVGCLGLLFSPYLDSSSYLARMVVKFQHGSHEEGNALALADSGIFLLLTSILVMFYGNFLNNKQKLIKWILLIFTLFGVVLGFWIASISSRGETFAGVISGCLLIILIKYRTVKIKYLTLASAFVILFVGTMIVFVLAGDNYQELSPRYSQESLSEGSDIRRDLITNAISLGFSSPDKMLLGIGARGCEEELGMYPHNALVQALSETGIIGFVLLCSCYALAFRFGFRTLSMAKERSNQESVLLVALMLSLLLYDLIVESKKGSLIFVDTYMWLLLAVFSFDRTQAAMKQDFCSLPRVVA